MRDEEQGKTVYPREEVKVTVHDLANVGWNKLEDAVVLMLKRGDEVVCPLYTYEHEFLLEEVDDTTYTDTLSVEIPAWVEEGAYRVVPMYRDNALGGGKEWREALTCTGTPNYLIASVEGDEVTLSSDTASTAYLTLEDIDIPDMLVNVQRTSYSVTVKNHNAEMAGRIYLIMEALDEGGTSFYLQKQGLTMAKDEVCELEFGKLVTSAPNLGRFRLHVCYDANLFADELIELPLPEEKIITIVRVADIEMAQRQ